MKDKLLYNLNSIKEHGQIIIIKKWLKFKLVIKNYFNVIVIIWIQLIIDTIFNWNKVCKTGNIENTLILVVSIQQLIH